MALIPRGNEGDLRSLPRTLLRQLEVKLVDDMEQVLRVALDAPPGERHTKRRVERRAEMLSQQASQEAGQGVRASRIASRKK